MPGDVSHIALAEEVQNVGKLKLRNPLSISL
jgi:hypothetical protein